MQRINAMAREEFWKHAEQAKSRGRDLAEVLDREGYLLTPERVREIEARTIEEIAELLGSTSPHKWTAGTTQLDLISAISTKLWALARERRK